MAKATATGFVGCDAEQYLAFVLDVENYRTVDDKIGRIDWVRTGGNVTEFRFRPTLPGFPPAPRAVSRMRLTPGERIEIEYAGGSQNRLVRRFSAFSASFTCSPSPDGVKVTRTISIELPPPASWLLDSYLQRCLQTSVERELELTATRFRR